MAQSKRALDIAKKLAARRKADAAAKRNPTKTKTAGAKKAAKPMAGKRVEYGKSVRATIGGKSVKAIAGNKIIRKKDGTYKFGGLAKKGDRYVTGSGTVRSKK